MKIGRGKVPILTRDVAYMVRCPVCREGPADPCNFLPDERVRPARNYENSYHHDRLREAENILDDYVLQAITNEIMLHARSTVRSVIEFWVAVWHRAKLLVSNL